MHLKYNNTDYYSPGMTVMNVKNAILYKKGKIHSQENKIISVLFTTDM